MSKNKRLTDLYQQGQSVWLDFLRRSLMSSGELQRLVDEGVMGMTSNPAIFEKAISGSSDYDEPLKALARSSPTLSPVQIYERLAIEDIQQAADVLRPVYEQTKQRDGYVSLEVSPFLANDLQGTLKEARDLWKRVDRANVMIKVPGTAAGIEAFRTMIGEGINTNVTLLFAREAYEKIAWTYLDALEERAKAGKPLHPVASVASFFVSRIDVLADAQLAEKLKTAAGADRTRLEALVGKVAVANARLAYETYEKLIGDPRWKALAAKGAQPQRVLWASTGTKNPKYRDVLYVEELIGADTVNTMPPETLAAFKEHGEVKETLKAGLKAARLTLKTLEEVGISLEKVTDELLADGVKKFSEPFTKLLASIDKRFHEGSATGLNRQSLSLPPGLASGVAAQQKDWAAQGGTRRLWAKDARLWSGTDEADWLGWLDIVDTQLGALAPLLALQAEAKKFKHLLLLGMGGSSLGPEMWKETFGVVPGFPELFVLDSTDPAQLKAFEEKLDLKQTLFIVASKSGSTLEPSIFKAYFFDRVKQAVGAAEAGSRFIAVTDPGSNLEKEAKADGFRLIFPGVKSIGGRYSVLSNFGMVPAAAMGLDPKKLLEAAKRMLTACGPEVPTEKNPGLELGTVLGVAAAQLIDKLTLVASPGIYDLGAWLEQLIAESTGKEGKGVIPIDRERLGPPSVYGSDRLFAYLRLADGADPAQDQAVLALEKAGRPVVRIEVSSKAELPQELIRWEVATAIAGAILHLNPFNQPDVEESKLATRALTQEYEKSGKLPAETAFYEGEGLKLYADARNEAALRTAVAGKASLTGYLAAHLTRLVKGDYFALLAYLPMSPANEEALQVSRLKVREKKNVATVLQFGPRFLHSTGQLYKGGPNSALVLQLTCDDAKDLAVPGKKYSFGAVKAAQARGDLQVLSERKRRALRIHLGPDVAAGLKTLSAALGRALT